MLTWCWDVNKLFRQIDPMVQVSFFFNKRDRQNAYKILVLKKLQYLSPFHLWNNPIKPQVPYKVALKIACLQTCCSLYIDSKKVKQEVNLT